MTPASTDSGRDGGHAPPLVSIGLAVYNGERYLAEAIDSALAQTFTDFELIISDNASTDTTAEIVSGYDDPRIRYHRNEINIGGANNENLTFELARGKYFRWLAHDDILAPEALARCVAVLDADPTVVLCHTLITIIDEHGQVVEHQRATKPRGLGPHQLFSRMVDDLHTCEETYGLMRASALAETGLQRNYTDSDRTLLAHMALLGHFAEIPERLFFRRVHPGASTQMYPDRRDRMRWFGDEYESSINLPFWSQLFHYVTVVGRSPVDPLTRAICFGRVGWWIVEYRHWRSLGRDLVNAAKQLVGRSVQRVGVRSAPTRNLTREATKRTP